MTVFGVEDSHKPYSALNAEDGKGKQIFETKMASLLMAEVDPLHRGDVCKGKQVCIEQGGKRLV